MRPAKLLLPFLLLGLGACSLDWDEPLATRDSNQDAAGAGDDSGSGDRQDAAATSGPTRDSGARDLGGERDAGPADAGSEPSDSGMPPPPLTCTGDGCDPCAAEPCLNDGICSRDGALATCTCQAGYSGDNCEVDACAVSPCLHGASCNRVSGGRECACVAPWYGPSCEHNDDAALSALGVSAGALWPAFDPDVLDYSVDLGFADPSIALIPTARVPEGASIRVEGVNLDSGATSAAKTLAINTSDGFTVEVTSNSDQRRTYSVTVRRSLVQRAYVKASGSAAADHQLGASLAMNDDVIVYGMPGANYTDTAKAGAVALLDRTRSLLDYGQWIPPPTPQADARFGSALALSGGDLAIAAPGEDIDMYTDPGAIYLYADDGSGSFAKTQRLIGPLTQTPTSFGQALALAGDVLVVGAPSAKQAWVYRRRLGVWAWEDTFSSSLDQSFFGQTVATDGTWIAVGGDERTLQLFRYDAESNEWQRQDPLLGERPDETLFGMAAVFRGDELAVTSGYGCLYGCNGLPALYTFKRAGSTWTQTRRVEIPKPPAVQDAANPRFFGIRLEYDGRDMLTSSFAESLGAHGVFPAIPPAETSAINASGAAYLYDLSASDSIELTAYIKASNPDEGDQFGSALAMSGGLIVVSASEEDSNAGGIDPATGSGDNSAPQAGALYVFGADCGVVPAGAPVPGC